MASAVKVKSEFTLAELNLDRRLKDETSYQHKLRKLQIAMLELEEIYRVERRRARGLGCFRQERRNPATDRKARPTLGAGLVDRPAQPREARPPLSLALLAEVAASRQYHDLRLNLVRASVLVEPVDGLARPKEWRRAYDEVNAFEKMLIDDGVRLVKLFLHMSDGEQLRRFRERVITPTKHWKMTAEDIHNRARRRDYLAALDDMFARWLRRGMSFRRNINGTQASP